MERDNVLLKNYLVPFGFFTIGVVANIYTTMKGFRGGLGFGIGYGTFLAFCTLPVSTSYIKNNHADFREDPYIKNHHPRGGIIRHDRDREVQDSGEGGNPP